MTPKTDAQRYKSKWIREESSKSLLVGSIFRDSDGAQGEVATIR